MSPIRILKGQRMESKQPAQTVDAQVKAQQAPIVSVTLPMTWKRYLVSALNAFVSGATAAAVSGLSARGVAGVSNIAAWKIAGLTACGAGFVSFVKWYQQHPLPGAE
jgi:hypothetical protein